MKQARALLVQGGFAPHPITLLNLVARLRFHSEGELLRALQWWMTRGKQIDMETTLEDFARTTHRWVKLSGPPADLILRT